MCSSPQRGHLQGTGAGAAGLDENMLVSPDKKPPEDAGASPGAGPAGAGAPALGIFEGGAGTLDEDMFLRAKIFGMNSSDEIIS